VSEFDAKVSAFIQKTEARAMAVFKESAQRTISAAQIGMGPAPGIPVDLGFARASIRASLTDMPQIDPSKTGPKKTESSSTDNNLHLNDVALTINGIQTGGTLYVGWTAAYVGYLEKGHSKQAPQGFVRIAALQWKRIVSEVSKELKGRIENR
jgi:hypothetical protein